MTAYDKSRYEKLQSNNNREAAKISALSFRKIGRYNFLKYNPLIKEERQNKLRLLILFQEKLEKQNKTKKRN